LSPLMTPPEVEVAYVRAVSRKLKGLIAVDVQDDLRCCCHGRHGEGVEFEEHDYYRSTTKIIHVPTTQVIPAGTFFVLSEVKRDQSYVADKDAIGFPFEGALKGTKIVMQTLDPRDPDNRLSFSYWAQDEPARSRFDRIDNEMAIIAIAATGL